MDTGRICWRGYSKVGRVAGTPLLPGCSFQRNFAGVLSEAKVPGGAGVIRSAQDGGFGCGVQEPLARFTANWARVRAGAPVAPLTR